MSLHNEICASCKMRKRGPNGMPIFCKRSSPKYGNSIIPTRSASKRFAYFCVSYIHGHMEKQHKTKKQRKKKENKMKKTNKFAVRLIFGKWFLLFFFGLPHSLKFSETISWAVDLRQRIFAIFSLALDLSDLVVRVRWYYLRQLRPILCFDAYSANEPLERDYFMERKMEIVFFYCQTMELINIDL